MPRPCTASINEKVVLNEFEKAGFKLEEEGNFIEKSG